MANVSRALRHKRHLRRHANQMLRAAKGSRKDALKYFSLLMTVLAQKGGEIVVTKGTIEQVEAKLTRLSFEIVKDKYVPEEFTIRLVEAPEPATIADPENADSSGEPFDDGEDGMDVASEGAQEIP